jgi:hypothetical protein
MAAGDPTIVRGVHLDNPRVVASGEERWVDLILV